MPSFLTGLKICRLVKQITLNYKMTTFDTYKEKQMKTWWEKGKMLVTSIFFFFPATFSTLQETNLMLCVTFNLLSANVSNSLESEILSSGKGYVLSC